VVRALLVLALVGCTPELLDTTSLVGGPRLLAVAAAPAEVRPGQPFTLRALDVSPAGEAGRAPAWSLCTERAPLTEAGPLSSTCLAGDGPALGTGIEVMGTVPRDVCRNFGPDQPPPRAGQPPGRPADPDATGGYYQPVRVRIPGEGDSAFAVRVLCNLGGATPEQQAAFDQGYRLNQAPALSGLFAAGGGRIPAVQEDPAAVSLVPAGATVSLRAAWPRCGDEACGGAERYLWFDPAARALVMRREAVRISWFATAGTFAAARTGEGETGEISESTNVWTAPQTPGDVRVWLVVRDDRGGLGWSSHRLRVP
jgi:hypothetical protein